jgi:hypothetical protein
VGLCCQYFSVSCPKPLILCWPRISTHSLHSFHSFLSYQAESCSFHHSSSWPRSSESWSPTTTSSAGATSTFRLYTTSPPDRSTCPNRADTSSRVSSPGWSARSLVSPDLRRSLEQERAGPPVVSASRPHRPFDILYMHWFYASVREDHIDETQLRPRSTTLVSSSASRSRLWCTRRPCFSCPVRSSRRDTRMSRRSLRV